MTRRLVATLALLLLSGCVPGFFGTPVPGPAPTKPQKITEPGAAPQSAAKKPPRPKQAAPQSMAPLAAGPPPAVDEARLAVPPDKKAVIGHSEDETETLLGKPARVTEEASAKVWHYQSGDCAIDVTFFFDISRDKFFALDVTPITGDVGRCLAKLEDHVAS